MQVSFFSEIFGSHYHVTLQSISNPVYTHKEG